jgi:hypothetical protein
MVGLSREGRAGCFRLGQQGIDVGSVLDEVSNAHLGQVMDVELMRSATVHAPIVGTSMRSLRTLHERQDGDSSD